VNSFNGTHYDVNDNYQMQFDSMSGTTGSVKFSTPNLVVISNCYSNKLNSDVVVGWYDTVVDIKNVGKGKRFLYNANSSENNSKSYFDDANPQLMLVNRTTGQVTSLFDIRGGAFLKCGCVVDDNGPNNTVLFHTAVLDFSQTQQYIATYCVNKKCDQKWTPFDFNTALTSSLSVVPNSTGLIVAADRSGDSPQLWLVDYDSNGVEVMFTYNTSYIETSLGTAVLTGTTMYTLLTDNQYQYDLATYDLMSNTTTYVHLNVSQFSYGISSMY